jgi:pimeloyl-ACP methyl ester carboxylesterase
MTEARLKYEDGELRLSDGRILAWRWWGEPTWAPVLRLQGTPGSRVGLNPHPEVQRALGVRYLMVDRPGFGGSTRLPGRNVAGFADDLVALLDHHGLERVPVVGGSGGGPHALAIAARHPNRVAAVSVVVGFAHIDADEARRLIGVNAAGYAAAELGWEANYRLSVEARTSMLGEGGVANTLSDAGDSDKAFLLDPSWRRVAQASISEALRDGAEGWTDENMALHRDWGFELEEVQTTVTWWHGDDDMNVPLSAAKRAAARLRRVDFRVWHGEGHLAPTLHQAEIIEELLSRSDL